MSQAHKHIPYKYMVQMAIDVYIPAKVTNISKDTNNNYELLTYQKGYKKC